MQTCMQKISKQLTTFIDHRRKGETLWLKKLKKNIGDIISKKEFGGSLRKTFRSLCLKKTQKIPALWQEKKVSLIYWERVSEMHLHVPVETQQFRKVHLNWTYLFLFIREWNGTFANQPDFWFTFSYLPNFEPILDRFAEFVSIPLCERNLSPSGPLERTAAYQYKIALMAV